MIRGPVLDDLSILVFHSKEMDQGLDGKALPDTHEELFAILIVLYIYGYVVALQFFPEIMESILFPP